MHPTLTAAADRRGGVFSRRAALAAGVTDDEIRHLVATGRWLRLRRGTYAVAPQGGAPPLTTRAAAALLAAPRGSAASHWSAAALTGLPLLRDHGALVHITTPGGRSRRRNDVWTHAARLRPEDVVELSGVHVTAPARTAIDIARVGRFDAAVVCADAVLRGGSDRSELYAALGFLGDVNGRPRARRVVEFADGGAESPGESLSRIAIENAGLPRPELQHEVLDERELVGRVDFWWPKWRVVGEFDGRVKYGDARDLWAEKQREDRMRALGLAVVRWVWADVVGDFGPVARRIVGASRRAVA